ncbi:MAG TPA: hypothetical protein VNR59_11610 [Gaiellaceae bacterium]|nr:hypothetical protein [Thermoleophilia bacterium]HWJ32978.1 hypothetical protein [Gaiellaceae bacterium]
MRRPGAPRPRLALIATIAASRNHHDGDCSFERILRVDELDDPALERIASFRS